MNRTLDQAKSRLVPVVRKLYRRTDVKLKLAEGKKRESDIDRPDFVWHELLLSFATMGNSRGADGLIRNANNYARVTFRALGKKKTKSARLKEIRTVLHAAKVRMPDKKAAWLAENFDMVVDLGGLSQAKKELLARPGRVQKMQFWRGFQGIGKNTHATS